MLKTYAGDFPDESWLKAISPIDNIPNVKVRAVPQYLSRGTKDPIIADAAVGAYAEALKAAGQNVNYASIPKLKC
jgi:acetyl esterase